MRQLSPRPVDPSFLPPVASAVVALQAADSLRAAGAEALRRVASALELELKAPLRCEARLLHAPVPPRSGRPGCCSLVLAFTQTSEYALLEIEESCAALLVDRLAGGRGGPFAPGAITNAEAAAIGFLGLSALRAVRGVAQIERDLVIRLACIARGPSEIEAILALEESWIAIDLALDIGGASGSARLLLPARALRRLARASASEPRVPDRPLAAARLPASVFAGRTELLADELARLVPGDAVLLSELERTPDGLSGACRLAFDTFHVRGRLAGNAFTSVTIEVADPLQEKTMNAPKPPPLPIEVEVELARINVPLSELGRLEPGAVLELRTSLQDPVLLRVGDRAVARAELVDVGGELGARVLELLG